MPNIWKMLLFGFITCFSFVELLCFVFFFNLCIVYYSCVGKSFSSLMALRARSTCVCVAFYHVIFFASTTSVCMKRVFFPGFKTNGVYTAVWVHHSKHVVHCMHDTQRSGKKEHGMKAKWWIDLSMCQSHKINRFILWYIPKLISDNSILCGVYWCVFRVHEGCFEHRTVNATSFLLSANAYK